MFYTLLLRGFFCVERSLMTKDKILDYSPVATDNHDLGLNGSPVSAFTDTGLKAVMSHLADVNLGTQPLSAGFTIADPNDPTKQVCFDVSGVPAGAKTILQIPAQSGMISTGTGGSSSDDNGCDYNHIINGDFNVWQRGIAGFGHNQHNADRFIVSANSSDAMLISRQEFALGQTDVPGNPKYFLRSSLTAGSGGGLNDLRQRIENVDAFSGKTLTLTYYVKGSINASIVNRRVNQDMGTGGSGGNLLFLPNIAVTTSWQKVQDVFTLQSLSGATKGVEDTDFLDVTFSLPVNQNVNLDTAHISLVEGDVSGQSDPFVSRPIAQEIALCQRYYFKGQLSLTGIVGLTNSAFRCGATLPVKMRTTPSVSASGKVYDGINAASIVSVSANHSTVTGLEMDLITTSGLIVGRPAVVYIDIPYSLQNPRFMI
jgi:hypothetical protein